MKKIVLSLLAIAATVNAFALNVVAQADITIKDATSAYQHTLTIAELTDPNASDYCAEIYEGSFGSVKVAFYAIANSKKYEIFASNDLEGQTLGVKTYNGTEYTLTFSNLDGEGKLYLVDAVANKTTEITEGGSYAFTAEANQTIADRFSITKVLPALPYSFINNVLVINEATEGAEVTITPFTYGAEGKVPDEDNKKTLPAPVNQVLTGGYFLVSYTNAEGVAREFIVNANPDIKLANP